MLDLNVSGLPPGDSAEIVVYAVFHSAHVHSRNGTTSLALVPYLTHVDPWPVLGSDGLTYRAPGVSANVVSRQTSSADIAYTAPQPGSTLGAVTANGSGIGGATVTLSGAASAVATTGSGGTYSFPNLPPGTYTLTVATSFPGIVFPQPSQTVTLLAGQNLTVNFAGNY